MFKTQAYNYLMQFPIKILFAVCAIFIGYSHPSMAQAKKKKEPAQKTDMREETPPPPEKTPEPPKIIYETIPAKEKPKVVEIESNSLTRPKEKNIIIKEATKPPVPKGDFKIVYDTGKQKTQPPPVVAPRKIDTSIVISAGRKKTDREDTLIINDEDNSVIKNPKGKSKEILTNNPYCTCVSMAIKSQDTIYYENYVNYSFTFRNNCKETVYINSACFSFSVVNVFGYRVKELRKVDYVKRFEYPEFVKLPPGESFEFRLADDPFFQFNMGKSERYKFRFMYNNTSYKSRSAPNKTYLCTKFEDKDVYVK